MLLQTLEKLFSRDWARACGKEKFTSMLSRENKGNASGKSDKVAMQEVHDMLKKHYQVENERGGKGGGCWGLLEGLVEKTPASLRLTLWRIFCSLLSPNTAADCFPRVCTYP